MLVVKLFISLLLFMSQAGGSGINHFGQSCQGLEFSAKKKSKKRNRGNNNRIKQPKTIHITSTGKKITLEDRANERLQEMKSGSVEYDEDAQTKQLARQYADRILQQSAQQKKISNALRNGAFTKEEINSQDSIGRTYLHYAVQNQWTDVVEQLLDQGANPDLKDAAGLTARDMAPSGSKIKAILDRY